MPGNYVKREAPICPQCHSRTSGIDTNVYFCSQCSLELSYNYQLHMLNIYALDDEGERIPQGNATYQMSVAENISPINGHVILSSREIGRVSILQMVIDGTLSTKKAAQFICLSVRQVRNLKQRFVQLGKAALIDGHSRSGRRGIPEEVRAQVITMARTDYAGLSLRQLQAVLSQQGINLHYSTIDRIIQGGVG